MFKKLLIFTSTLLLLVGFGLGTASAAPYVSGNLGVVMVDDATLSEPGLSVDLSTDPGLAITAAVGNSYDQLRAEIEFAYRVSDNDKLSANGIGVDIGGDLTAMSLMANIYLDFTSGSSITPFIGGGLGMANVESELSLLGVGASADDDVFAYQFMGGLSFNITPKAALDIQYRYFATDDPTFDGVDAEYQSHNALVGLRLMF